MNNPGIITIKLEGVTFEETERCRRIIHKLFELGFFNVKNGSFLVNFDSQGEIGATEKIFKWRNDKPLNSFNSLEQYKIELMPVDKSTIAKRV